MKIIPLFLYLLCVLGPARAETLTLARTIPLPGVEGRIDHFALDDAGGRLFVAALGNNTVEVVDLKQGKVVRSIGGLAACRTEKAGFRFSSAAIPVERIIGGE